MANPAENLINDYLSHHRYDPPERDGWFSSYEIYRGIVDELGKRVRSYKLYPALDTMLEAQPPVLEDTWMMSDESGAPIVDQQYRHPNQPKGARRFYRVVQASVEYIAPQ